MTLIINNFNKTTLNKQLLLIRITNAYLLFKLNSLSMLKSKGTYLYLERQDVCEKITQKYWIIEIRIPIQQI